MAWSPGRDAIAKIQQGRVVDRLLRRLLDLILMRGYTRKCLEQVYLDTEIRSTGFGSCRVLGHTMTELGRHK